MKASVNRAVSRTLAYLRRRDWIDRRRNRPMEIVWERAAEQSAQFICDNQSDAVLFDRKEALWDMALAEMPNAGAIMECGVFQGASINHIADWMSRHGDARAVHGFDSFEGLEENWTGENLRRGFFNQHGKMPSVRRSVTLHKGWVQDTIMPFLSEHAVDRIALLHIDTDTYLPARYILATLKDRLAGGGIVIFDELLGYPNWQAHEYRALTEEIDRNSYRFIGFTSRQAAIRFV